MRDRNVVRQAREGLREIARETAVEVLPVVAIHTTTHGTAWFGSQASSGGPGKKHRARSQETCGQGESVFGFSSRWEAKRGVKV